MTSQVLARRVITLLLVCAMICIAVGAVKIQESRVYPAGSNPGSSPAMVGTAAFKNSTTTDLSAPYKTNSWLSPVLWADSKTLIYPNDAFIRKGERHPLYQLPIYPFPWSIYYSIAPVDEVKVLFPFLNVVDPDDTTNYIVPRGLFIRPMPVFPLYDTQLQLPDGTNPTTADHNIYDLAGRYSAPTIRLDPGFNASNMRISRMGDYDARIILADTDDPSLKTPAGASLSMEVVRGSPFIQYTLNKIPDLNLSFWHGKSFSHSTREVTVGGKKITGEIIETQFMSYGPGGAQVNLVQSTYWENQTIVFFYPSGSATYSQISLDPLYGNKNQGGRWLFNRTDASFSFADVADPSYLVVATIPSSGYLDDQAMQILAAGAFQYAEKTSVQYTYSQETATVQAAYTLQTKDPLGIGGKPVQGLVPLHYGEFFGKPSSLTSTADWVTNATGTTMVMDSIFGQVKFLKGNTFTCSYQYPGILPYIPGLPAGDTAGRAELTKWLENVEQMIAPPGWGDWKYTGLGNDIGADTYGGGKVIWSASNIYRTAQGLKPSIVTDASDVAARSVSLFFADDPKIITKSNGKQAPYYSYYDPKASTLILYPAGTSDKWPPNDEPVIQWDGYGTATKLNDHHYTWGYYINAAAEIGLDNQTWMEAHKQVINELVFDVAYDPALIEKPRFSYPKARSWDPYMGHSQAGGMTYLEQDGNNDESLSEEMHFWAGVIRWGSASNQPDIETLGIVHYTQAMYAYFTFWRDYFNNYPKLWSKIKGDGFDPLWFSKNYVCQAWDGKMKYGTHFGPHPAQVSSITVLPMTGASFYHAADTAGIESLVSSYLSYVKKWDIDPMNPKGKVWQDNTSPWGGVLAYYGELACWYALADPAKARATFFPLDAETGNKQNEKYPTIPMNQFTEGGKSAAEVYHFIRFLEDYGKPDPLSVHATNTPYYMTFVKNGVRTYVGYNPTNEPMDISFSDSRIIKGVQPKQFGIWPSGIPGPINASFTADPKSGVAPLLVKFTDTSQGQIVSWAWTFGDGGSSTDQNPTHTFTTEGTFNVTLTVTDSTEKTGSYSGTVTTGYVKASYTADPKGGIAPLLVKFTDTTQGTIVSRAWTFGDGGTSTEQNPTHTYATTGLFNVTLTVTDSTQKTSSCSDTISVRKSGELPGNFSISTLESGSGTIGLYPSIATNGVNQTYVSYFSSPSSQPWVDKSKGSIGVITMDMSTHPITIKKEKNVVDLIYHVYPPQVFQPEWGRSMLVLDSDKKPVVACTEPGDNYPWPLTLSYTSGDTWGKAKVTDDFPWYPAVAVLPGEFPTVGFISGTGKNVNYAYNSGKDYSKGWGIVAIIPSHDQSTFATSMAYLTHLYNGTEKTPSMIYYNKTSQEIYDSWMPNKQAVGAWMTSVVRSGVNAGWVSAASEPDTGKIGICWYDLTDKTLKFMELPGGGSWGIPEVVDTSGHDVGSNCSLAYGPASGKLSGPGISYYDATAKSLKFAWKDPTGWHTTEVDTGGAGTSSALAYASDGTPRIAYRHEGSNSLKIASLTEGSGLETSFTSDVRSGQVPLTVRFSDQTLNTSSSIQALGLDESDPLFDFAYWWDLNGDGEWEDMDDPNPVFTYETPGTYDVKMLVHFEMNLFFIRINYWGVSDIEDYITASGPSESDFTASPLSGTPPLRVTFTDTSNGGFTSWNWTFGDGTTSHEQNPIHTYGGIGRYTVTLEASGPNGSVITRKPAYIDVNSGTRTGPAGMLKISSDPEGAMIILDGTSQGITPVQSLITSAGKHELILQKDGYADWKQGISVSTNKLTIIPRVILRKSAE